MSAALLGRALRKIPPPLATYRSPRAVFEVYRAKDMHASRWNDSALKDMVMLCRMSYVRYGKRPPFDLQDKKAAVYLVRVKYQRSESVFHPTARKASDPVPLEEWLSLRMVPGDGRPTGIFEPEIFWYGKKRIDRVMKEKIGARRFWHRVASSSRMCGIHPYFIAKNWTVTFMKDEGHRYTPICFAIMHKQFAIDYPIARFPYQYITGMIRTDFYLRGLTYHVGDRAVRPLFTAAHRFLGIEKSALHVKRDAYSYSFPLYWFDAHKLLVLVNTLRIKQHKKSLTKLTPEMFLNLPKRADRELPIAGIRIKPELMRSLIDKSVPDAPELKITEAKPWYRSMDRVLKAAKIMIYN
jgi:hypothetical protein